MVPSQILQAKNLEVGRFRVSGLGGCRAPGSRSGCGHPQRRGSRSGWGGCGSIPSGTATGCLAPQKSPPRSKPAPKIPSRFRTAPNMDLKQCVDFRIDFRIRKEHFLRLLPGIPSHRAAYDRRISLNQAVDLKYRMHSNLRHRRNSLCRSLQAR